MSTTPKLGMKLFAESDIVDFNDINDNTSKIDSAFTWTQLNNTWYTGKQGTAISLPEDFNEISIKVNIGGQNIICKLNVCAEELYSENRTQSFRTGYYLSTNFDTANAGTENWHPSASGGSAQFAICKESINLEYAWLNGENVNTTAATTWTVYTK